MMRPLFLTMAVSVVAAFTVLLVACTMPVAHNDRSQPLTLDPGVLSGQLQNGFRYYLRSANSSSESDRLELRLVVKAGSLDEAPDQRGYAHVVEHMAFRGTESFSLAAIESLLSENGLRWGVDVNATTHYGATVYRFSLHNSDENLLPSILSLMSEWLDSIQFDPRALEKEKLIVNAEWRERYVARNYVVDPVAASAYSGSQYENRQPAGDLDIVRASTANELRRFWRSHYRADNAVLVMTGGAHPWQYESMITAAFSHLTATPDKAEQSVITDTLGADLPASDLTDQFADHTGSDLSGNSEPGLKYFKDGTTVELLSTTDPTLSLPRLSVNLVSKFDPLPTDVESSVEAIKKRFRGQLLFSAFSYFLRDRVAADPLCSVATLDASLLESGQTVEHLTITLTQDAIRSCLAVAFNAVGSVQKSKLTEEEYAGFANLFERIMQLSLDQYRARNAASIASGLVDMVTNGEVVLSAWSMQKVLTEVVESFDRDVLNEMINRITETHRLVISVVTNGNEPYPVNGLIAALNESKPRVPKRIRSLVVYGQLRPDQTQIRVASRDRSLDALQSIVLPEMMERASSAKPVDRVVTQSSGQISGLAAGRSVTKLRVEENYHEWRLANGATVILLQDEEYDQVAVSAIREGGYQSLSGIAAIAARHLPAYLSANGVDGYTSRSLRNIMQKKNLFAEIYVDASHHGVRASGRSEELPVMLSLLKAYFSEPLILEPQNGSYLRQLKAGKSAAGDRALSTGGSAENLDTDDFLRVHDELFGTTGNFSFVFAGLVDADQLERELHRLIVGDQSIVPIAHRAVSSTTDNVVVLNRQEKFTNVTLNFSCDASADTRMGSKNQELLQWQLLSDVISERLRYSLREEPGLVYEIESKVPASARLLHQLFFSILPQDEEMVLSALSKVLLQLSSSGVNESEINSALARKMRYRLIDPVGYDAVVRDKAQQWLYSGDLLTPDDYTVNLQQVNRLAHCLDGSLQQVATDSRMSPAIPATRPTASGMLVEQSDESALQQSPSADR